MVKVKKIEQRHLKKSVSCPNGQRRKPVQSPTEFISRNEHSDTYHNLSNINKVALSSTQDEDFSKKEN